ncbi:hypothetical protein AB6G37_04245 [Staphylococcus ureilyticus]|uniref:hypothetical protein n=1 Tax=Staphylococcus TaxID=1279 RepID=UPI0008A4F5AD|nr:MULTISPECIES: hypothetical protein [Staphylococcus]OFQ96127.1 hypothetical protein HMPREF2913_04550 [Staphylococcus sp. HMSC065A08]OHO40269.1 hypothetical protein HMPREF2586_01230 [Staphylococcus sp. HMSC034G07]OLF33292.1 hypothetical protein BSZ11_06530 [Staphylococcus sp. 47.1]
MSVEYLSKTNRNMIVAVMIICAFIAILNQTLLNTAGINALHKREISHGAAISNFGRVTAGSIGTALMVTVMTIGTKIYTQNARGIENKELLQRQAIANGVEFSFIVISVFVVIGFIIALFIKENRDVNEFNMRKV